jgi:protein tyrosine phosphatase (PTP) superfamily phosphohydrolase (DUF442 family)
MQADRPQDTVLDALPRTHSGLPDSDLLRISDVPPLHRFWAYWLRDHAMLRVVLPNAYQVDDYLWRGAHPGRGQLKRLKISGIASILSLRGGGNTMPNAEERAICDALKLPLHHLSMRASSPPPPGVVVDLLTLLREMPKPLFVHCKSGADRTAFAVTLYLHVLRGIPLTEARQAFSWRYGHLRWGKVRVLHNFLDAYAAAQDATGIGFEDWVSTRYNPDTLKDMNQREKP